MRSRSLLRLACSLGLALFLAPSQASEALQELQPARAIFHDADGDRAADASLPFRWDRERRTSGRATFEFTLPAADAGRQSIYIARVGNAYRVRLDDVVLEDNTTPGPRWVNTSRLPRLVSLPNDLPLAGRVLRVDVEAIQGHDGGLSNVLLGPAAELATLHMEATRWRIGGAAVIAAVSFLLGSLALLVWFYQREKLFLWYGLAELLWSLRTAGGNLVEHMWLPWPWWSIVMLALYCGAFAAMCYFGLTLVDAHRGRWGLVVKVFIVSSLVLSVGTNLYELFELRRAWRIVILAVCGSCAAVVFFRAWRTRAREPLVLACVCLVALVIGMRDWYVITYSRSNYASVAWVTYIWLLFGVTMAWLLAHRLRNATAAQVAHAEDLARKLQLQEFELVRAFADQKQAAERQVAAEERRRVLQDMHDGVGHELLGALQISNEDAVTREAVTQQIQRALDHLKLTVDVLQEGAQDIATVLGLLRYRLEPRLRSAAIAMEWHVDAIPPLPGWDTAKSRELQLLMFEGFTNIIAHSGAHRVVLDASWDPTAGTLTIQLADDGKGLPPVVRAGQGLESMRLRARRLGSELQIGNGLVAGCSGACLRLVVRFGAARTPQAGAVSGLPAAG